MFSWENGTEIAIWGTGKRARKFYLRYRYYFKVVNFIDNFPKKDNLDQIDIVLPNQLARKKVKIVIAIDNYKEVCSQCKELGMDFYDEEETPFLPRDLICRLLLNINKGWYAFS